LPQGFVQNAVSASDYARRVQQEGLATVRGWALTADDRLRGFVIERLMCDFSFSSRTLAEISAAQRPIYGARPMPSLPRISTDWSSGPRMVSA
jgi:oxygen-independent coproporphyrinogen-3 oxidase